MNEMIDGFSVSDLVVVDNSDDAIDKIMPITQTARDLLGEMKNFHLVNISRNLLAEQLYAAMIDEHRKRVEMRMMSADNAAAESIRVEQHKEAILRSGLFPEGLLTLTKTSIGVSDINVKTYLDVTQYAVRTLYRVFALNQKADPDSKQFQTAQALSQSAADPKYGLLQSVDLNNDGSQSPLDRMLIYLAKWFMDPFSQSTIKKYTDSKFASPLQRQIWAEVKIAQSPILPPNSSLDPDILKAASIWRFLKRKYDSGLMLGGHLPVEGGKMLSGIIILPELQPFVK